MQHLPLAKSVALLHPAVLTVVWILSSFATPLQSLISFLLLISIICGWSCAIYVVSLAKAPQDGQPRWTGWIFLAPPLLAVIAEIARLPTSNSPIAFLIFGTFFFGLWRAAQALEYADPQGKPVTVGRIAGTMLLMFFTIVGVWWLRHRIVRVAGSPAA
jgi:hypothetical protein